MANWSNDTCDGDIERRSCFLTSAEMGELDAVAAIRIVMSCLSLLGALSIIVSTITKREFFNHKVHPIFILSIADTILGLLYIMGGILWLRRQNDNDDSWSRAWCFVVTVPTVILQCVTVNLTLVYALLAYAGVRQAYIGNLLSTAGERGSPWSPLKTTLSHIIAWLLPVVIVMVPFIAVVVDTGLLGRVDDCSCWCYPSLGNVMPYAYNRDKDTMIFVRDVRKLMVVFSSVIGTHFLVGFIALVFVYRFMIKSIRKMRVTVQSQASTSSYGTVVPAHAEAVLEKAEFQAKRRVLFFLMAFIVSGFFNVILSYQIMMFDLVHLVKGETPSPQVADIIHQSLYQKVYYITLCCQSVTITQQGFLNAIVYGWTREDFLSLVGVRSGAKKLHNETELSTSDTEEEVMEGGEDRSARWPTASKEEHSFTRSMMLDTDMSNSDLEESK